MMKKGRKILIALDVTTGILLLCGAFWFWIYGNFIIGRSVLGLADKDVSSIAGAILFALLVVTVIRHILKDKGIIK